jgi:hypothetical protein
MDGTDPQVQTAQDAQALQDELAAQEAAAREYQPQLEASLAAICVRRGNF